jgi:hypothetical protein
MLNEAKPTDERGYFGVQDIRKLTGLGRQASTRLAQHLGVYVGNRFLVSRAKLEAYLRGDRSTVETNDQ